MLTCNSVAAFFITARTDFKYSNIRFLRWNLGEIILCETERKLQAKSESFDEM